MPRAIGNPTQKMWITTPISIIFREKGNFVAPERGTNDAVHEGE